MPTSDPLDDLQTVGRALSSGMRLGRYELLEPIGRGGMGVVWRARDTYLRDRCSRSAASSAPRATIPRVDPGPGR